MEANTISMDSFVMESAKSRIGAAIKENKAFAYYETIAIYAEYMAAENYVACLSLFKAIVGMHFAETDKFVASLLWKAYCDCEHAFESHFPDTNEGKLAFWKFVNWSNELMGEYGLAI